MEPVFEQIAVANAEAAEEQGLEPMEGTPNRIVLWRQLAMRRTLPVYAFPFLGGYLPEGWRRVSLRCVADTKGVNMNENEGAGAYVVAMPDVAETVGALDVFEFAYRISPEFAYAIVGQSAEAVLVGAYKRTTNQGESRE